MQVSALVAEERDDTGPTVELELVSLVESVERREHERFRVELDVSAWTLAQATSRLPGRRSTSCASVILAAA